MNASPQPSSFRIAARGTGLALALLLGASSPHAQAPDVEWQRLITDVGVQPASVTRVLSASSRSFAVLAGSDVSVRAVDPASGATLWQSQYPSPGPGVLAPVAADVAEDGSALYVLASPSGNGPVELLRFDGATGAVDSVASFSSTNGDDVVGEALLLAGDRIHLIWRTKDGLERALVTLAADDGSQLWTQSSVGILLFADALLDAGDVLVAARGGATEAYLDGLDPATGAVLWTTPFVPGFGFSAAVSTDGSVGAVQIIGGVSGAGPGLFAFDPDSGVELWSNGLSGGAVAVSDDGGQVFAFVAGDDGGVRAFDGADGTEQWATTMPASPFDSQLEFSSGAQRVVAANAIGGTVFTEVLDPTSGGPLWSATLDTASGTSAELFALASNDSRVIVPGSVAGTFQRDLLRAYDTDDGTVDWDAELAVALRLTELALDAIETADGASVISLARVANPGGVHMLVSRVESASGDLSWKSEIDATKLGANGGSLFATPDGAQVFARFLDDGEFVVAKLDGTTGDVAWRRAFPDYIEWVLGFDEDGGAVSPDGSTVYVVWHRGAVAQATEYAIAALDAGTGATIWEASFDPSTIRDIPLGATLSPDGARLLVFGEAYYPSPSPPGGVSQGQVVCLDAATGAQLWEDHRQVQLLKSDGTFSDAGGIVSHVLADESVAYVAVQFERESGGSPAGMGLYALSLDSGEELWSAAPEPLTEPDSMVLSPDGRRLAVGGSTYSFTFQQGIDRDAVALVHDTQDGSQLWRVDRDFSFLEGRSTVAVGEDGNTVVVATTSQMGDILEFSPSGPVDDARVATAAYDLETGGLLWQARYGGPIDDGTSVVDALVSDDRVILAGTTPSAAGDLDAYFVAYPVPTLVPDVAAISIAGAETLTLALRPGTAHAGQPYAVLGSTSGADPGTALGGGLVLPLADDGYFRATAAATAAPLQRFRGDLDARGLGTAALALPSGLDPALAGIRLHHALVVMHDDGHPSYVSNVAMTELMP